MLNTASFVMLFVLLERDDVVGADARVLEGVVVDDVGEMVFRRMTMLLHCSVEEHVDLELCLGPALVM